MQQLFDQLVGKYLGPPADKGKIKGIDPNAITLRYEPVMPKHAIPDIDDVLPEYQDQYIGPRLLFPFRGPL